MSLLFFAAFFFDLNIRLLLVVISRDILTYFFLFGKGKKEAFDGLKSGDMSENRKGKMQRYLNA